jgi:hypothetical protein
MRGTTARSTAPLPHMLLSRGRSPPVPVIRAEARGSPSRRATVRRPSLRGGRKGAVARRNRFPNRQATVRYLEGPRASWHNASVATDATNRAGASGATIRTIRHDTTGDWAFAGGRSFAGGSEDGTLRHWNEDDSPGTPGGLK